MLGGTLAAGCVGERSSGSCTTNADCRGGQFCNTELGRCIVPGEDAGVDTQVSDTTSSDTSTRDDADTDTQVDTASMDTSAQDTPTDTSVTLPSVVVDATDTLAVSDNLQPNRVVSFQADLQGALLVFSSTAYEIRREIEGALGVYDTISFADGGVLGATLLPNWAVFAGEVNSYLVARTPGSNVQGLLRTDAGAETAVPALDVALLETQEAGEPVRRQVGFALLEADRATLTAWKMTPIDACGTPCSAVAENVCPCQVAQLAAPDGAQLNRIESVFDTNSRNTIIYATSIDADGTQIHAAVWDDAGQQLDWLELASPLRVRLSARILRTPTPDTLVVGAIGQFTTARIVGTQPFELELGDFISATALDAANVEGLPILIQRDADGDRLALLQTSSLDVVDLEVPLQTSLHALAAPPGPSGELFVLADDGVHDFRVMP